MTGVARSPRAGRPAVATRTAFAAILAKDLQVELRTLQSVPAMGIFAVTSFVLFHFALDRSRLDGSLAAGVLLATLLFASMLGISRLFVAERDQGGFDAILLAPIDRTALLLAKAAAMFIYLVLLETVSVPVFAVFFLDGGAGLGALAAVLALLDAGVAAAGALISSMAVNARARELITPLILLPLLMPLLIAAANAGDGLLAAGGPDYTGFGKWLAVLGLYDAVFMLIAYAVFDFLVED